MSDEEAQFTAYFAARRDVVCRTAYLLCGDWHFAEDLTQLAFLRLASTWGRIRDHGALDAYVHTTLIRGYVAESRRWFRRRERLTGDFGTVVASRARTDPGAADDVGDRMAMAAVLRRLPPRQRAVIVARFYTDLDVSAAAEALGCSTGTVKSQTSRAMAALRSHLAEFDIAISEGVPHAAPRSS